MVDTMQMAFPSQVFRSSTYGKPEEQTKADDHFTEVYVKNLDPWYDTEERVKQLFRPYGIVTSARLLRNDKGQTIGVAFVTFSEHYMALDACRKANGMLTRFGHGMYVDRAFTRQEWKERHEKQRNTGICRVFVKNLNSRVDDAMLFQKFRRFGPILSAKVAQNEKGYSLCHGVVVFLYERAAERAIAELDDFEWFGRYLVVEEFVPFSERKKVEPKSTYGRKLLVKGEGIDEQSLREVFQTFGKVEDIQMNYENGLGFVVFADKAMAQAALANTKLARSMLAGREISFKLAEPEIRKRSNSRPVHYFQCQICFENKNNDHLLVFGCEHQFCWDCVKAYLESMIDDYVTALTCPENHCPQVIDDELIQKLVSRYRFEKYVGLKQKNSMGDRHRSSTMESSISPVQGSRAQLANINHENMCSHCHQRHLTDKTGRMCGALRNFVGNR